MIDHIGFPVSDYARAKAFYTQALDMAGLPLQPNHAVTTCQPCSRTPVSSCPRAKHIADDHGAQRTTATHGRTEWAKLD